MSTGNPSLILPPDPSAVAGSSFTQKIVGLSVRLAQATATNQPSTFAESGTDTVTPSSLTNPLRISARIQNSGTPAGSMAQVEVYGLTLSLMNQLSTLGMVLNNIPRNTLTISAGDSLTGLSTVFSGTITNAYGDFNASPNVPFRFECNSGLADAVLPAAPSSFTGPTDVGTVMSGIARQLGYGFENSGVSVKLSNPYLSGSLQTQWQKLARDAGINAAIINGTILAIWPKFGSRNGEAPTIAPPPAGGMIGYPSYTQQGILVKNIYNPQIGYGGQVVVSGSILPRANGTWSVYKLDHALDALTPKGLWESAVYCYGSNSNPILTPA